MNSSKKLIINADDYGACPEVNLAIEQIAATGILGGVSVLANGECWLQSVDFLRDKPDLSAGVHLNAVEGQPVSSAREIKVLTGEDGLFLGTGALIRRWAVRPTAVSVSIEVEWRAQIERLASAGLSLKHADSHQHLHAFPPAYRCAVSLCKEYGIPALRHPREVASRPGQRNGAQALRLSLAISRGMIRRTNLLHNDYFLGFMRVGAYGITELVADLQTIPTGLTEIALHPSITDGVPYATLYGDRERKALLDPSLPDRIKHLGIDLTNWSTAAYESHQQTSDLGDAVSDGADGDNLRRQRRDSRATR
jgi:predicted glycoside hydrolase/deacetylase ChbG (UPF0249 family)